MEKFLCVVHQDEKLWPNSELQMPNGDVRKVPLAWITQDFVRSMGNHVRVFLGKSHKKYRKTMTLVQMPRDVRPFKDAYLELDEPYYVNAEHKVLICVSKFANIFGVPPSPKIVLSYEQVV